jgi:adenylate kinase
MVQLSTGDMLREAKDSGTEMGNRVAEVMARGDLVTDEIVIGLIREKLEGDNGGGFIFDGFPRTLAQADALGELLSDMGQSLDHVIEMQVNDDVLVTAHRQPRRGGCRRGQARARRRQRGQPAHPLGAYYKQTSPSDRLLLRQGSAQRVRWPC